MSSIPWVEFYRPSKFDDVVLDPLNKIIMKNIIETSYFPHLLLYGPPGTGKTSSVMILINEYHKKHNQRTSELTITLNASNDRGVDIIRNQISQFVNSKTLFGKGMKFVILDEVDYMTKNAQQALHYLIQSYSSTVRFCLICNYISRIDEGLQNEFLRLRFNQLPKNDIIQFLKNISDNEGLNITINSLNLIQNLYGSDMRSMINFMQSNQNIIDSNFNIIDVTVWETIYNKFIKKASIAELDAYIQEISINYNIDKKNIIKDFLNYIIRNKPHVISRDCLKFVENIMHYQDCKNSYYINYSLARLSSFVSKDS
uniref:AAA+ ATPase domain-containing protein n=1 Tax=viral metagenome TaxID=1070528 RepID=A0A6C0JYS6_9ZZZZ